MKNLFARVFFLILIPSYAFGTVQLNMKDGSIVCGSYVANDSAYCRSIVGGDICVQKTEIASVKTVEECGETIEAEAKGTDYLKKHETTKNDLILKKRVREGGWSYEDDAYARKRRKSEDNE